MYLLIFLFRNLSTWSRLVLNEAWYEWLYHSRYVRRYHSNKEMFYSADFHSKEQTLEHADAIIHSEQDIAQNKRRLLSDDQINCRIQVYITSLRYWISIACNAHKIMLKDTDLHGWLMLTIEIWKPAGHCDRQETNRAGHTWNRAGQWPVTGGYFMRYVLV